MLGAAHLSIIQWMERIRRPPKRMTIDPYLRPINDPIDRHPGAGEPRGRLRSGVGIQRSPCADYLRRGQLHPPHYRRRTGHLRKEWLAHHPREWTTRVPGGAVHRYRIQRAIRTAGYVTSARPATTVCATAGPAPCMRRCEPVPTADPFSSTTPNAPIPSARTTAAHCASSTAPSATATTMPSRRARRQSSKDLYAIGFVPIRRHHFGRIDPPFHL